MVKPSNGKSIMPSIADILYEAQLVHDSNYYFLIELFKKYGEEVRNKTLEWSASNVSIKEEESYNGGFNPEKLSMYDKIQVIDIESILSGKTNPELEIE